MRETRRAERDIQRKDKFIPGEDIERHGEIEERERHEKRGRRET